MVIPEKLYIEKRKPRYSYLTACTNKNQDDDIEYVRKDAFIERAAEWLSKHAKKYYFNKEKYLGTDELVEDFKIAMEL